jgi:hypothetical protein
MANKQILTEYEFFFVYNAITVDTCNALPCAYFNGLNSWLLRLVLELARHIDMSNSASLQSGPSSSFAYYFATRGVCFGFSFKCFLIRGTSICSRGDGSKVGFYGGRTNKYLLSLKQMKTELQNLPF